MISSLKSVEKKNETFLNFVVFAWILCRANGIESNQLNKIKYIIK